MTLIFLIFALSSVAWAMWHTRQMRRPMDSLDAMLTREDTRDWDPTEAGSRRRHPAGRRRGQDS